MILERSRWGRIVKYQLLSSSRVASDRIADSGTLLMYRLCSSSTMGASKHQEKYQCVVAWGT